MDTFSAVRVFLRLTRYTRFWTAWESLVAKGNVNQLRGSSMSKYQNVKKSIFCIGDPKTINMLFASVCMSFFKKHVWWGRSILVFQVRYRRLFMIRYFQLLYFIFWNVILYVIINQIWSFNHFKHIISSAIEIRTLQPSPSQTVGAVKPRSLPLKKKRWSSRWVGSARHGTEKETTKSWGTQWSDGSWVPCFLNPQERISRSPIVGSMGQLYIYIILTFMNDWFFMVNVT